MKFTADFLEGAARCASVEELLAYAEKNAVALTAEEAGKLWEDLTRDYAALSDSEIAAVAGGGYGGGTTAADSSALPRL